jgi:hypothetical protein
MSCEFEIDVERRLVRATLRGALTGAELRDMSARLAADPAFRPDFSVLIDLSGATSEALTAKDMQGLARNSKLSRGARRAFVCQDPALFGLARMFTTYREMHHALEYSSVFRTVAEAEAWLAERPIDEPPDEPAR